MGQCLLLEQHRSRLVRFGVHLLVGSDQSFEFSVFEDGAPFGQYCKVVFLLEVEIGCDFCRLERLVCISIVSDVEICEQRLFSVRLFDLSTLLLLLGFERFCLDVLLQLLIYLFPALDLCFQVLMLLLQ